MISLMDFILANLRFLLNHYMFIEFKKRTNEKFYSVITDLDWDSLTKKDEYDEKRVEEVKDEIKSLIESLREVERINSRFS